MMSCDQSQWLAVVLARLIIRVVARELSVIVSKLVIYSGRSLGS